LRRTLEEKKLKTRSAAVALALTAGGILAAPAPARAQAAADSALAPTLPPDSLAPYVPHAGPLAGHSIHWYEPLAVIGGIGLLSTLDQPIANRVRDGRSSSALSVANGWARIGTPVVYGPVTLGILAGGLLSHNSKVTHTGLRLAFSLALAGAAYGGLNSTFGRERPNANTSAFDFDPGHFDRAFPSGHTTMAFAMATSLADDVHPTWAKIGLYGAATGVAVSRVYQEQHWFSDVVGGAVLGFASAKLVSGRWRLFGIQTPGFLMNSGRPALGWHFNFHE
jgi:membrane-associated phospholipid phosphatase